MKKQSTRLVIIFVATSFTIGVFCGHYCPKFKSYLRPTIHNLLNTKHGGWPEEFKVVTIPSSTDGAEQFAYYLGAPSGKKKPLVVSLHTWSCDFSKNDRLAPMVMDEGWNYIHPDFRGPNRTLEACLSQKAVSDIDDAIQYAIEHGNVDLSSIFVVGSSGGGYATLGAYLKTRHRIRCFFSWAPISDLAAWYHQSLKINPKYRRDILNCTSENNIFNEHEARSRSPLFWDLPENLPGRLELYAGINDGYAGCVPISHSILFYNRVAEHLGNENNLVDSDDLVRLLTRGIPQNDDMETIGGRKIKYKRDTASLSLTIFDGAHEMLPRYCFNRMKEIAEKDAGMEGDSAATVPASNHLR
jgi:pimeloyl-ACP methyl ester carboxylesterase